jgi:zinc protease
MNSSGIITAKDITRLVLPNGIVLLVRENHATQSVSLRGVIKAGAMYDSDEKAGMADFTADAMERGTKNRSYQAINKELDSLGATLGIGASDESAGFYGRALTEDFDALLAVAGDIVLQPTFPRAEVEKVRGEILTDLEEAKSDTQWVSDYEFHKAMYPAGHPYHRPTEGTAETVAGLTRADLAAFHKMYYRPDTTIIAVVGDITPQQAVDKITRVFGAWHATAPAHPYSIPDVRGTTTALRKTVHLAGKTQADIVLGFPGLSRRSPDFHPANVSNLILGVLGLSGRLGDNVRDKQGLAYYVYSSVRAGNGAGPWLVRAGVNPANIDKAIAGIMVELKHLLQEPVSDGELLEAQDFLTGSLALRLETNDGVASMLLSMETYDLGLDYLERYNGIIRGLTAPALLEATRKYIDLERMVVVVAGPVQGVEV